jgi:anti-anti-sigma factor
MEGMEEEVVIALGGELDVSNALETRHRIVGDLAPGRTVVVDLAAVDFMDSSGLGALVYALREAGACGGRLVVHDPQPRVRRLFESALVAELFGLDGEGVATSEPAVVPEVDEDLVAEVRTLLLGYENLLRWGDLTPEQVTVALRGAAVADGATDLALADRVRAALAGLGVEPPTPDPSDLD